MSLITRVPEPNLWDSICKEFSLKKPPFREDDEISVKTEKLDYDPCIHHPVFFGKMQCKVKIDDDPLMEFDASISHPASIGYAFVEKPPESPPPEPPKPPNKDTCPPRQYLEHYIFPVLLPALEEMLREAKKEKCFERKRTKFNALDFLTEYLYKKNPQHDDRQDVTLLDIPFVQEWLKDHPRPPLPLSLIWTEEEATTVIQSFWRGYKVRLAPEIQELRQWQKEWREENADIKNKVDDFWAKQMPNGSSLSTPPGTSQEKHTEGNAEECPLIQTDKTE